MGARTMKTGSKKSKDVKEQVEQEEADHCFLQRWIFTDNARAVREQPDSQQPTQAV